LTNKKKGKKEQIISSFLFTAILRRLLSKSWKEILQDELVACDI